MLERPRQTATDRRPAGQAMVEFALVIPILMLLVMAVFEFALLFNAIVGVNRASQHGAHLAATVTTFGADCLILSQIESDIAPPNDRDEIRSVVIGRTTLNGETFYQKQTWNRLDSGSDPCELADGSTILVPYDLVEAGYTAPDERCPAVKGCDWMDPPRSTVDNIGVSVTYHHTWATPLNAIFDFFGGGDGGWTIEQRNVFRMEPTL